jgi:hypothetical protein
MLRVATYHAGLDVAGQQFNAESIQSGSDRRDLVQNIDAIAIFIDHSLNSGNLPGNPVGSASDLFTRFFFHVNTYTPYRYIEQDQVVGGEMARLKKNRV